MNKVIPLVALITSLLSALSSEIKQDERTYFDSDSGLFWQDNKDTQTLRKKWNNAKQYCDKLNHADYNNWRLPSNEELFAIYKKESNLINLASSRYWSSSEYDQETSRALYVGFYDGRISHSSKSNKLYVRCVRTN